jgi:hypothetical protein
MLRGMVEFCSICSCEKNDVVFLFPFFGFCELEKQQQLTNSVFDLSPHARLPNHRLRD